MRLIPFIAACCVCAVPAMAEPMGAKDAKAVLFSSKKVEVEVVTDALSDKDAAVLAQVGVSQPYYGAIAISPDEGILTEATFAAANFHDVDSAGRSAVAECNARRTKGTRACVVAVHIRPEGWEPRDLQLNPEATVALRKEYRKGRGAKAMAVSQQTGQWAIGKGEAAQDDALRACTVAAKADDCRIVIHDPAK